MEPGPRSLMPVTNDHDRSPANPEWTVCLERTRRAVLNILVAVGLTIAVGGWLLRGRAAAQRPPAHPVGLPMLMLSLILLAVASYLARRLARRHAARTKPSRRQALFYWSHVDSAAVAVFVAALGIFCGWFIDSRFEAVIPFWVVALALGFQAIPRTHELDDYVRPYTDPGEPRHERH
jgi:drug/metabolite transporter (DMT)-like permease